MSTNSLPPPHRAIQLSSAIIVLLAADCLPVFAQYSVRSIGPFPYDDTFVYRLTPDGHVLGTTTGDYKAFHWFQGMFRHINDSQTPTISVATDIDSSGNIVGWYETPAPQYYIHAAFLDPVFQDMGTLSTDCLATSRAYATASGTTVGEAGSPGCAYLRPFSYSGSGPMVEMPIPSDAQQGQVFAINPSGTVAVGQAFGPQYTHAIKWFVGGGFEDIGISLGSGSEAVAINANNDILCHLGGQSFLWTGSAQLIDYMGQDCYARGLNDLRQVVADTTDASGNQISIVWQNGASQVLPTLPGTIFTEVWSINNEGHAFGFCVMSSGAYMVEWVPPLFGMDISDGNPSSSNWQGVMNMGKRFVIVDGWKGETCNALAEQELNGARMAGMLTAGYCVINFESSLDGGCQVKKAFKAFGSEAQYLNFLAIDVEDALWSANDDTPNGHARAATRIREAVQTANRAGLNPIIYTSQGYWKKIVGNTTEFGNLPLWLTLSTDTPDLPDVSFGGWAEAAGKQYLKELYLPGFPPQVDLDIFSIGPFTPPLPGSYAFPPPEIHFQLSSGTLTLAWCDEDSPYVLEQSERLTGLWTTVTTQGSSYDVTISDQTPASMLFRLRQQ